FIGQFIDKESLPGLYSWFHTAFLHCNTLKKKDGHHCRQGQGYCDLEYPGKNRTSLFAFNKLQSHFSLKLYLLYFFLFSLFHADPRILYIVDEQNSLGTFLYV